jgi:enolase
MVTITKVEGFEVKDSRGTPTVGVRVTLSDGTTSEAKVPSGTSAGEREALELRDGDANYAKGKGVKKAIANVNGPLAQALIDKDPTDQKGIDDAMLTLDGTPNKGNLGANAILGISMAVARAAAKSKGEPLYVYLSKLYGGANAPAPKQLPVGFYNLINGGQHTKDPTTLDFQELGVIPTGAHSIEEAGDMVNAVYDQLGVLLRKTYPDVQLGAEGGYMPNISVEGGLKLLKRAIEECGYKGRMFIGMDVAASEFFDKATQKYKVQPSDNQKPHDRHNLLSSAEFVDYLDDLRKKYPILSIEDGMGENDIKGWELLHQRMGDKVQLVGDDLTTTDPKSVKENFTHKRINATLIKVNQIGTLTETLAAIHETKDADKGNGQAMISHRSGETRDDFIADLAVATSSQIKPGVPSLNPVESVAVRRAKHNRLLTISKELGKDAHFPGLSAFAAGHQQAAADRIAADWHPERGTLIILRHGQSTDNAKNIFTGWANPELSTLGRQQATYAGKNIAQFLRESGQRIDTLFSSDLKRAVDTAGIVLESLTGGRLLNGDVKLQQDARIRERNYGDWTGKDKAVTVAAIGDAEYQRIRRGYETSPPNGQVSANPMDINSRQGESLKTLVEGTGPGKPGRVEQFRTDQIEKQLAAGKNVVISAHGNSLRALLVAMGIKDKKSIETTELGTAEPIVINWDAKNKGYQMQTMPKQAFIG